MQSSFCIAIASHISNINRIPYLQECVRSLVSQSTPIPIYLSISFATNEIQEKTLNQIHKDVAQTEYLNIRVRKEKTAQMRHYFKLYQEISQKHKWVMFCDDDDTYHPDRTDKIMQAIVSTTAHIDSVNELSDDTLHTLKFAGLYENISQPTHHTKRHEYWCYCIQMDLLTTFFEKVEPIPGILDDRCCDVLFGEYLRRKSPEWIYARIEQPLYNYREEENDESVTGIIQMNQHKYTNQTSPPPMGDSKWLDYVITWNGYLKDNMHIFLHDIYLRTLVGCDLNTILQAEFQNNYFILDYVDQKHIAQITELHERVTLVCKEIYDIVL